MPERVRRDRPLEDELADLTAYPDRPKITTGSSDTDLKQRFRHSSVHLGPPFHNICGSSDSTKNDPLPRTPSSSPPSETHSAPTAQPLDTRRSTAWAPLANRPPTASPGAAEPTTARHAGAAAFRTDDTSRSLQQALIA